MRHHSLIETSPPLETIESRQKLAKMIIRLFKHWQINTSAQLNLLGLSETSRAVLANYAKGVTPIANHRDMLDRIGWLLAIHKALRLLYPYNEQLRYSWITRKNAVFNQHCPLDIMQEQGLLGIAQVARYLDFLRGQ